MSLQSWHSNRNQISYPWGELLVTKSMMLLGFLEVVTWFFGCVSKLPIPCISLFVPRWVHATLVKYLSNFKPSPSNVVYKLFKPDLTNPLPSLSLEESGDFDLLPDEEKEKPDAWCKTFDDILGANGYYIVDITSVFQVYLVLAL